jgi:8-oxo-dGTP diphosphatase
MIETQNLHLTTLTPADAAAMVPLANDIGVAGNLGLMPHPYAITDAEDFIARVKKHEADFFAIRLKDMTLIGICGHALQGEPLRPELGYWLGRAFWAKGYGREAVTALVAHSFAATGADELTAGVRIGNTASFRILSQLGFKQYGAETVHSRGLNGPMETELFSLTRAVWLARQGHPGQIAL